MQLLNQRAISIRRLVQIIAIFIPLAIAGNFTFIAITTESQALGSLGSCRIEYLALACFAVLVPWAAHSARIVLWGKAFNRNISSMQALKTAMATDVGAAATPTLAGGGYIKAFLLAKYGFSSGEAALMMILGTMEDAMFFAIALPLSLFISRAWENPHVIQAVDKVITKLPWIVGIAIVAILLLSILRRIKAPSSFKPMFAAKGFLARALQWIDKLKNEFIDAGEFVLRNGKLTFMLCMLIGGIGWIGRYGAISLLLLGLGYHVDPVLHFLLQWVVFTTMTMVPTPGAVGGAEISFALIYSSFLPMSVIPILTGVWRFVTFYMTIIMASLFLSFANFGFQRSEKVIKRE